MDKYGTGIKGEIEAQKYLCEKGYIIVDANVNYPKVGEIDIIAKDGSTLVFVEVRTRADNAFGNPLETLTKSKINKIIASSRRYLMDNKVVYEAYRYDVIGIVHDEITHIKNAFYARWN